MSNVTLFGNVMLLYIGITVLVYLLAYWVNVHAFLSSADYYVYSKSTFLKKYLRNTSRVSNSIQIRTDVTATSVWLDLGTKCVNRRHLLVKSKYVKFRVV